MSADTLQDKGRSRDRPTLDKTRMSTRGDGSADLTATSFGQYLHGLFLLRIEAAFRAHTCAGRAVGYLG